MREPKPEAWITGAGIVSPWGAGRRAFCEALRGSNPLSRGLLGPAATLDAAGFSAEEFIDPKAVRRVSALTRSSLVAARMALSDAGFPEDEGLRRDAGVVLGTAFGSSNYHFEYYEALFRRGLKEASPLLFSESVMNASSGHVSQFFKLRGPSITIVGGEDAGIAAVASAVDQIRAAGGPALLAGGGEEHCAMLHRTLAAAGVVAGPNAPRDGGERPIWTDGAAFLLVEEERAALRRGASPLAVLRGAGWGRAGRAMAERGDAVAAAVEAALEDAAIDPRDVEAIVGSEGPSGGLEEMGLAAALGGRLQGYLGTRSLLGEGFAFTSAAQVIIAALAVASDGALPKGFPRSPEAAIAVTPTRRGGACAVIVGRVPSPS